MIKDSCNIYLNNDKQIDKLIILSPKSQENINITNLYPDDLNKRLLIGLNASNKKYKFSFINENAILNSQDYQSEPLKKISYKNSILILSFFTGSSIKCNYDLLFYKKTRS